MYISRCLIFKFNKIMKHAILLLLNLFLFKFSLLFGQDVEKMNKSELKEHVNILTLKIDSLKSEYSNLQMLKNTLNKNNSILEEKGQENRLEINRLNGLISKIESEKNQIVLDKESIITKLNNSIKTIKDSISNLQVSNNSVSSNSTLNKNDFLNNYYFNQIPLTNNSFRLILSKVIYGNVESMNRNNYYDKNNTGVLNNLPELLDAKEVTFWSVKPNKTIVNNTTFNDYVTAQPNDYLNSKLPRIDILKNKLFTLTYEDASEESFLFNIAENINDKNGNKTPLLNNQRKVLQIELANEDVKENGSNNNEKDIIWRIYAVENECYLALTAGQLNRLKINLFESSQGIEVKDNDEIKYAKDAHDYHNYLSGSITTGKGIYLSRNVDIFMNSSNYINPSNVVYLFKLK